MRRKDLIIATAIESGIKIDVGAANLVGMPDAHVRVFKQAAITTKCVISSRQVGRVCTQLLEEGYSTKGFRIKSKSCDFGPMAGFVCANEKFHKKGSSYDAKQKEDIDHAINGDEWDTTGQWKAGTQQICLSQKRVNELINWNDADFQNARITPTSIGENWKFGTVILNNIIMMKYILHREYRNGDIVFALYQYPTTISDEYIKIFLSKNNSSNIDNGNQKILNIIKSIDAVPVLALTNPYPPYPHNHYKNACTGDYDLFGVWPKLENFQIDGEEDRRLGGMLQDEERRNDQIFEGEDKRLGNISERVQFAAQTINSLANSLTNFSSNIVNHSDEAGRPCVTDIEDHVIAFVPLNNFVFVLGMNSPQEKQGKRDDDAKKQWKGFIKICGMAGYQVIINAGWMSFIRNDLKMSGDFITTGSDTGFKGTNYYK